MILARTQRTGQAEAVNLAAAARGDPDVLRPEVAVDQSRLALAGIDKPATQIDQ